MIYNSTLQRKTRMSRGKLERRAPLKAKLKSQMRRVRLRAKVDRKLIEWSRRVRERDDYTCQVTGVRDPLRNVAHHVAPRGRRRDLKYVVENGITVTPTIHDWIHAYPIESTAAGLLSDETYEAAAKERRAAA